MLSQMSTKYKSYQVSKRSDRFIFFYEYNVHVVNEFYNKYALPGLSLSSSHIKCAVMDHFNTFCIEHRLWLLTA